jgi:flagellar biosynthesis protein FlhF
MRLKSYFASTVEEAISLASREMGEDAMLVYSRETMPEARNLGRYEVGFALESESQQVADQVGESGSVSATSTAQMLRPSGSDAPWQDLRADLMEMKRQFTRMERLMIQTTGVVAASRWSPPCEELFQELLALEFPVDFAARLVSAVEQRHAPGVACDRATNVAELAAQIGTLPCGRPALGESRAHAFIGPAGGGKTTMLVKLAVLLGMEQRLPVMLVSLDFRRIGGSEQLKTFAQILGAPFSAVGHRAALERLIETEARRQTLFLDMPGFSEEDLREQAWMPAVFRESNQVRSHLVLPAFVRTKECARIARRYEAFQPSSLMLTHMDDSEAVGGVIAEMVRYGLPISYCGTGQSIPEDIRAGEPEWLAWRALGVMEEAAAGGSREGASWALA